MAKRRKKKKKNRQGQKINPSKSQEVRYRRRLLSIVNQITRLVNKQLVPAIRNLEHEFVADAKSTARVRLVQILNDLNKQSQQTNKNAFKWSESFVRGTDKENERRNFRMFQRTIGIDLDRIIMNEGLTQGLRDDISMNVDLIKSIPNKYFFRLNRILNESLTEGRPAKSLIEQITELGHSTKARAKFIARDQTATISGKLNERRSKNLDSMGYKWITSGDRRVRGNPSGLYPNAPFDHWDRNGEYFLWTKSSKKIISPNGKPFRQPPEDGNPGQPIGCRCTAIPVVPVG